MQPYEVKRVANVMTGRPPPARPAYLKAVVATAPFVALVAYSVRLVKIPIPTIGLVLMAFVVTLLAALTIHLRVLDDWRAQWGMDTCNRDRLGGE